MSPPDTRPPANDAESIARRAAERALDQRAIRDDAAFRERVLVQLENIVTRVAAIEETRLPAIEASFAAHVADDKKQFIEVNQTIGDTKGRVSTIWAVCGVLVVLATLAVGVAKLFT